MKIKKNCLCYTWSSFQILYLLENTAKKYNKVNRWFKLCRYILTWITKGLNWVTSNHKSNKTSSNRLDLFHEFRGNRRDILKENTVIIRNVFCIIYLIYWEQFFSTSRLEKKKLFAICYLYGNKMEVHFCLDFRLTWIE